jgi:hypothetical protein
VRASQFSDQRFDRLLDHVYDAATDQALWRSMLTETADLTRSQGQSGISS